MRTLKSAVAALAVSAALPLLATAGAAQATTVRSCTPTQIVVSHGRAQGAAGTAYYPIVFTNRGPSCQIFGVPEIQPVAGKTHWPVGPMARNGSMGEMPVLHTLKSGQSVSDGVGFGDVLNYPKSRCAPKNVSGVLVSLGSFVTRRYVSLKEAVCTKLASVSTRLVVAGVAGN